LRKLEGRGGTSAYMRREKGEGGKHKRWAEEEGSKTEIGDKPNFFATNRWGGGRRRKRCRRRW